MKHICRSLKTRKRESLTINMGLRLNNPVSIQTRMPRVVLDPGEDLEGSPLGVGLDRADNAAETFSKKFSHHMVVVDLGRSKLLEVATLKPPWMSVSLRHAEEPKNKSHTRRSLIAGHAMVLVWKTVWSVQVALLARVRVPGHSFSIMGSKWQAHVVRAKERDF